MLSVSNVVVFIKTAGKKKISKAERLRLLQEEEERRLKEEGTHVWRMLHQITVAQNPGQRLTATQLLSIFNRL